ncbi:MAG: hypothetical protein H7249_15175 [Chitinophagaceae bacterium]|nr:hypothetical protein [Oligoflexus sp.]
MVNPRSFTFGLVALAAAFIAWTTPSRAATMVGPKHVYIMYPGLDALWGSYIFVVNNDGTAPEQYSFPVMLPKETLDFQAQDTLSPQELKLGPDGGITVDKSFSPGETLIQISFKLPASQGSSIATFKAPYPFESLGIFVWQDSFSVNAPTGVQIQKGVNLSGRTFDTYSVGAGTAGQTVVYTFDGIAEGRGRLWWVGGVVAAVLILTGLGIAFFTRPKLSLNEEVV